jgi:hypothetical protein
MRRTSRSVVPGKSTLAWNSGLSLYSRSRRLTADSTCGCSASSVVVKKTCATDPAAASPAALPLAAATLRPTAADSSPSQVSRGTSTSPRRRGASVSLTSRCDETLPLTICSRLPLLRATISKSRASGVRSGAPLPP